FFQAEDGIRDKLVTGVQTCALPICEGRERAGGDVERRDRRGSRPEDAREVVADRLQRVELAALDQVHAAEDVVDQRDTRLTGARSEERRVGKECRSWGAAGDAEETM